MAESSPGMYGISFGNQRRNSGLRHRQRARGRRFRQSRAQTCRGRGCAHLRRAVFARGIRGAPPRLGAQPLARSGKCRDGKPGERAGAIPSRSRSHRCRHRQGGARSPQLLSQGASCGRGDGNKSGSQEALAHTHLNALLLTSYFTTNETLLVSVLPPEVVTVTLPEVAPAGTVVVISVAETTVKAADVPLKLTAVAPVKPLPRILTFVPVFPTVGAVWTKGARPVVNPKIVPKLVGPPL